VMAALGGHLASTKPGYRITFWSLGLLTAIVVVIVGIRTEHAQSALQTQLNKIQKNTETPPQVTVNPAQVTILPSAPKQLARVSFDEAVTADLVEGQEAHVSLYWSNSGDASAYDFHGGGKIYLVPNPGGLEKEKELEKGIVTQFLKDVVPIIKEGPHIPLNPGKVRIPMKVIRIPN
jgi:hypothetical protein